MASSSSKGQNTNIISKADILERLKDSCTFSWCAYRNRDIIIRHVGFLIMFDGEPFCTVDFTGESLNPSCLVACRSKVVIERVSSGFENTVDSVNDIQRLDTRDEKGKKKAKNTIDGLITLKPKFYKLFKNNCRDYTRDAVDRVCDSGQCNVVSVGDTRQMLLTTRTVDRMIIAGLAGIVGVVAISLIYKSS